MIHVDVSGRSMLEREEIKKAITTTLKAVRIKDALVSVAFVGSAEMRKWNALYRKKQQATDVLSFGFSKPGKDEAKWKRIGELLISESEARKNAREKRISLRSEVMLLLVHGALHLAGFDHEQKKDAEIMFSLQEVILKKL